MRVSEVRKLSWYQIYGNFVQLIKTKSNQKRKIYLYTEVRTPLDKLPRLGDRVFPFISSSTTVSHKFNDICDDIGLSKQYSPYWLRHSFATYTIENSKDVYGTKDILGHADLKTTEIYTHYNPEQQQNIIENFGKTMPVLQKLDN